MRQAATIEDTSGDVADNQGRTDTDTPEPDYPGYEFVFEKQVGGFHAQMFMRTPTPEQNRRFQRTISRVIDRLLAEECEAESGAAG